MNPVQQYIKISEEKWQNKLYSFCQEIFSQVKIPSHDHTHHLRVWEISKEILLALNSNYEFNQDFTDACIIASFFHDTGLSKTLDENHGKESRKICQNYFEENNIPKPHRFEEILTAIEKHDDKNYKNEQTDPGSLLSIICTADDIDAFGNIGVVRYTEIYLLRGISLTELPDLVIKNLDNRFLNIEKTYQNFPELIKKIKKRYLVTKTFFNHLKDESENFYR